MRAWLTFTMLIAFASSAEADTDLVMLGPIPSGTVAPGYVKQIGQQLDQGALATRATRAIDHACAQTPDCLVGVGSKLAARRVVAIGVSEAGGELTVGITLVDVSGKELVARRDVKIKANKLARELVPAIKQFLAEAPVERAKGLFADGDKAFNLGEFEQALALYTHAYRIKPLPGFLFNIAQCHRKLGHYQDAITTYQSFLASHPDASNRSVVESLIKEAQDKLADEQKLALERAAEDGRREAERLAAEKQRAADERKAKEAEARTAAERRRAEQARIDAELEKLYDRHPARKWMIVTGALGAGALITAGVFGLGARNAHAQFHDAGCGDPNVLVSSEVFASCLDDRDRGQRYALLSNVFLIGGGAVLAASGIVFMIDPGNRERPETPHARAGVGLSARSIHVVVQW